MIRLRGWLSNKWRSLQRRRGGRPLLRFDWRTKLLMVSMICVVLAVLGLRLTEGLQASRQASVLKKQQQERLAEAARGWALQRALLELAKDGDKPDRAATVRRLLRNFERQAREGLGTGEERRGDPPTTIYDYMIADDTQLRATLISFAGRGSLALLLISILFVAAIFIIPFLKSVVEKVGEQQAQRTFDPGNSREPASGAAVPSVLPGFGVSSSSSSEVAPPAISGTNLSPGAGIGGAGLIAGLRQSVVPAVVAAGVFFAVGALLIDVPGREVSVDPNVRIPNVGLEIGDFSVAVQPGRVDIPAAQIVSEPKVQTRVPPIEFHFPAAHLEQQALTALTSELAEYRQSLLLLANRDRELEEQRVLIERQQEVIGSQQEAINRIDLQNEAFEKYLAQIEAAVHDQSEIEARLQESLKTLASAAEVQQYGDRLAGRQYARRLNTQNRRIFNQIFRPGLIRENCATYRAVESEIPDLAECTDAWLHDKLRKP